MHAFDVVYTLQELMDSWLTQSHFPLITVTLPANNRLHIQQQPFLLESSPIATSTSTAAASSTATATTTTTIAAGGSGALWIVPLRIVCKHNGVRLTTAAVMRARELEIQLPAAVR
jgi:hypothetical protein